MLGQQPRLQLQQRDRAASVDMRRQRSLLMCAELARAMPTVRVGPAVTGQPPPDQCLVDIGRADPERHRSGPDGYPAIHRRQNPVSQIPRVALPGSPTHLSAPSLVAESYESHDRALGNPLSIPLIVKVL